MKRARQRRGRSAGKRLGPGWYPAKLGSARAWEQDRPAVPPGTGGVRGVAAARVAFVVGRGGHGLRGGVLGVGGFACMGDDPYGVLVKIRVWSVPPGTGGRGVVAAGIRLCCGAWRRFACMGDHPYGGLVRIRDWPGRRAGCLALWYN